MGCVLALMCCSWLSACSGSGTGDGGLSVTFRFDPPAPAVGTARLALRLVDPAGQPVQGASVAVEANMDHAGMVPTFATLAEDGPGHYVGDVAFTMGGDWFLQLDVTLADGRKVSRTLDVPGVRSDG